MSAPSARCVAHVSRQGALHGEQGGCRETDDARPRRIGVYSEYPGEYNAGVSNTRIITSDIIMTSGRH
ncbi:hypothetical protein ACRALDRAFT_2061346 [Sodiomyces alcalophilus JCM 7366]|uniref:uncharacterized protein n=1 Tax=Sodiomyces alcalophilus JCM 7366 TaxID=591952 RepID=UPI0039B49086